MPYFSPSTGGFYATEFHGKDIPDDAVKITKRHHQELMLAQQQGHEIVAGPKGPTIRYARTDEGLELRAAVARVKREAKRRILAIASLERQANDNAALALGGDSTDYASARERRHKIDAVRAASNAIEAKLEGFTAQELTAFDAATAAWPE